ncbi:hypothetical protein B0T09DRAFT_368540 [Sordaria sp. MPI-SDFR-AT-0083]|nr:hypothetical protein B0T09DRAFT_368540 [Sordaria sp. MPI-SDFR-AT-0083]
MACPGCCASFCVPPATAVLFPTRTLYAPGRILHYPTIPNAPIAHSRLHSSSRHDLEPGCAFRRHSRGVSPGSAA